jgi:signal peptidase I
VEPDLYSASVEVSAPGRAPVGAPTGPPPVTRRGRGNAPAPPPRSKKWVFEWLAVLAIALVLAVCVRTFVAQMFYIPSGSMLPTLQIGDRIVVNKLSYDLHGVERGDVVVFRRPPLEQVNYADLVKRVIGLPGDTIATVHGMVYINGKPLDEPWLSTPLPVTSPSPLPDAFSLSRPFTVPAGQYFVMGDNRTNSEDSRYFGPISKDLIVGKMAFKAWPLDDSTWLAILSIIGVVVLVLLLLALRAPRPPPAPGGSSPRGPPASNGSR